MPPLCACSAALGFNAGSQSCRLSRHTYSFPFLLLSPPPLQWATQHALHFECLFFFALLSPFHVFKLPYVASLSSEPVALPSCSVGLAVALAVRLAVESETRKRLTLLIDCSQQLFVLYTAFISS